MPGYRAGAGAGLFGSHTTPPNRPMVDVGGAIDSFVNGSSSLIQQAYQRKRMDREEMERRDAVAYQRSRDTVADQRYADEQTYKRTLDERNHNTELMKLGITPAHQEQHPAVTMMPGEGASVAIGALRPIQRAMGAVPGPQLTPSASNPESQQLAQSIARPEVPTAAPTQMRLAKPVSSTKTVDVAQSYDYDNSLKGREEAAKGNRLAEAAIAAGATPEQAKLIAADPSIAPRLLAPAKGAPHFVQNENGTWTSVDPLTGKGKLVTDESGKPVVGKLPASAADHFTFPVGADEEGNPVIMRGNTKTGALESTGQAGKAGSAAGQREAAQISTAQNQVAQAHKDMLRYEEKLLSGKTKISAMAAMEAKTMMSGGAFVSSAAEAALNKMNPELAAYVRSAKTVTAAERLITPRGGSNALTNTESILSQAGPGANEKLIRQAQAYREALATGLSQHGNSKHGNNPGGNTTGGAQPSGATTSAHPLQEKYNAAVAHLRAQGKSDADILSVLGPPPGGE